MMGTCVRDHMGREQALSFYNNLFSREQIHSREVRQDKLSGRTLSIHEDGGSLKLPFTTSPSAQWAPGFQHMTYSNPPQTMATLNLLPP